jgi:hypothetical protein
MLGIGLIIAFCFIMFLKEIRGPTTDIVGAAQPIQLGCSMRGVTDTVEKMIRRKFEFSMLDPKNTRIEMASIRTTDVGNRRICDADGTILFPDGSGLGFPVKWIMQDTDDGGSRLVLVKPDDDTFRIPAP